MVYNLLLMNLAESIKKKTIELGFDLVGITDTSPLTAEQTKLFTDWLNAGYAGQMTYLQRNLEKRINPAMHLKDAKSIICVGLNYALPIQRKANISAPTGSIAAFAQYEDYHLFIKKKLRELTVFIASQSGSDLKFKICVDSAPIAEKALAKIKAKFDQTEAKVDDKNIFEYLLKVAPEGDVVDEGGELQKGENLAVSTVEETYLDGYVAHATLETHTSIAQVEGNKITVWASTQAPFRVKGQVAEALGFPPANVRIITPFVGGGFGGKSPNQQSIEAARLANLTGKPVQVAWTRAEEFYYDTFRPAAVVKIKSGLSDSGKIAFWDYHVYCAGSRGSQQFYNIPHHRTVSYRSDRGSASPHPFATGAWRAPGNNTNCFARESQIQVMAVKAGMDPLDFWLKNLREEKMRQVLKTAAAKFGYTPAKSPSGRGYGIGCGIDVGTYVATIAEVDVDNNTGNVQVKSVVCAQDMGLVINPEGARLQMEGCITMGLGYALTEDVHFKGGEILDLNFDTYEIPRFSWLPKIETVLVNTDDPVPQGGGEPAIIVMGGVIANAIYDAIGVRLYQLPMTPERIKEAMSTG